MLRSRFLVGKMMPLMKAPVYSRLSVRPFSDKKDETPEGKSDQTEE